MANKTTLQTICTQYCNIEHNDDNYSIGGGLDSSKFASRRHEDARNDEGKLTLGEATQLFKKATELDTDQVREVIEYAVPNMEWHHAGKLPKAYGGGMKKTYFLNATEICDLAKNWDDNVQKLELSKIAKKNIAEEKKNFEGKKLNFLQTNAKRVVRVKNKPMFSEYFSGWEFESEEKYHEFLNLK